MPVISEEKSFKCVTDDAREMITITHPEPCSGELKTKKMEFIVTGKYKQHFNLNLIQKQFLIKLNFQVILWTDSQPKIMCKSVLFIFFS